MTEQKYEFGEVEDYRVEFKAWCAIKKVGKPLLQGLSKNLSIRRRGAQAAYTLPAEGSFRVKAGKVWHGGPR